MALNFATRTPTMQHVREPDHGRAWIGSPYLRSLIVSHAFNALPWIEALTRELSTCRVHLSHCSRYIISRAKAHMIVNLPFASQRTRFFPGTLYASAHIANRQAAWLGPQSICPYTLSTHSRHAYNRAPDSLSPEASMAYIAVSAARSSVLHPAQRSSSSPTTR
jgi:hypothetical protein